MPSGPGCIEEGTIAEICAWLNAEAPDVWSFLLTPEQDVAAIVEQQKRLKANTLQLVDALTTGSYADLRQALPSVRIVQVLHVEDDTVVAQARRFGPEEVDAILLDSGRPSLAIKELGGTGRVHDWAISKLVVEAARVPVFLAGGLKDVNVADAIRQVKPHGLDLCSGLRSGPDFDLDEEKLAAFVRAVALTAAPNGGATDNRQVGNNHH